LGSADLLLILLLPSLILFHLVLAPYTKVEESFNLQATHDILLYGTPEGARLQATFDHFEFPGAVPRTFFGAVILAGVSRPVVDVLGWQHAQLVVRAVLGLFNAFTLLRYADGVRKAFGATAARWWIALLLGQFHVLFYASRTLPNMFAFGLSESIHLHLVIWNRTNVLEKARWRCENFSLSPRRQTQRRRQSVAIVLQSTFSSYQA
jgi:alpha-1,6-mannosyltransferase